MKHAKITPVSKYRADRQRLKDALIMIRILRAQNGIQKMIIERLESTIKQQGESHV